MNLLLERKIAIVTGGSKGIGKGIAAALVADGCKVVICARHKDELTQAAQDLKKIGPDVLPVVADLTNEEDIEKVVKQAIDQFGHIDILVNNAGTIGPTSSFEETSTEAWRQLFELNLFAVVTLTRRVIPYMKKQNEGRIINISSENGQQPYPDMIPYSASKGALNNFTKSLSKEVASDGILVNAVSPAFIETPLVNNMMQEQADEKNITREEAVQNFLEKNRPHIELKRPGTVDEVGLAVAFLASDKASFITGANLRVDGGSVAAV